MEELLIGTTVTQKAGVRCRVLVKAKGKRQKAKGKRQKAKRVSGKVV
jgi:hypothetical protein